MSRRARLILWSVGGGLAVLVISLAAVYRAVRYTPEFYTHALATDPAALAAGRDRMLDRAAALASNIQKGGRWEAIFTTDEINGWLALELQRSYPDALPAEFRDVRVAIQSQQIMLACRYSHSSADTVLWVALEPYIAEPNVLALRIRKLRAGRLPLPMNRVLKALSQAAEHSALPLQWRQAEGDPVALLSLPVEGNDHAAAVNIDTLELRQGELYLAGSSRRRAANR